MDRPLPAICIFRSLLFALFISFGNERFTLKITFSLKMVGIENWFSLFEKDSICIMESSKWIHIWNNEVHFNPASSLLKSVSSKNGDRLDSQAPNFLANLWFFLFPPDLVCECLCWRSREHEPGCSHLTAWNIRSTHCLWHSQTTFFLEVHFN